MIGIVVEGVVNGDCVGSVGVIDVVLVIGDCRFGNMVSFGVEDFCVVGIVVGG